MEPRAPIAEPISRRAMLAGALAAGAGLAAGAPARAEDKLKEIIIAEPAHQIGYAPLYFAINQGYFRKRGFDVKMLTATGGAHVTALVSGQVWANIGGPESNAMANVGKSDPLLSVVNVVNRANVYMVAKTGLAPKSKSNADVAAMMKGRKMAFSRYGGTPDVLARWYVEKVGLDPKRDVQIINQADTAAAPLLVKQGAADIVATSEPFITVGKEMGVWGEPFFGFPSLGDYAYSVISVRRSTITADPKMVQSFVEAMVDALRVVASNRALVADSMRKEFPTLPEAGLHGALDRAYADTLWSKDGVISPEGVARDMDVVLKSGEFTKATAFNDIVDMRFVKKGK